ncbi:hypothetical protein N665_1079s0019 [Sinapis alba]|nr:hypothetical protein N665_1079s0019 [Sinapis alba]
MERSGTGSRQRRASSIEQKLRLGDCNVVAKDQISNGSFMDIKTRLKECSNALTTSKELLKIINRMWGQEEYRSSSSVSLVSALHSELERARLQINQLIHEHRPENNDVTYLMKRFAEEKAAWKSSEQEVVEAAIESVAGELEVERKLRRRFESLNKKLGKELAEAKHHLEEKQLHNQESEEYLNHQEIEDDNEEDDLHSIELNIDKSYKGTYGEENNRGRKSTSSQSLSLQRSVSNWVVQSEKLQKSGGLDWGRPIKGYLDDTQACKPNKASSKDHHLFSGPRLSNFRGGSIPRSRLSDAAKGENQSVRRSRW